MGQWNAMKNYGDPSYSGADKGSNLAIFCKIGTMAEILHSIRQMYEKHKIAWRQLILSFFIDLLTLEFLVSSKSV